MGGRDDHDLTALQRRRSLRVGYWLRLEPVKRSVAAPTPPQHDRDSEHGCDQCDGAGIDDEHSFAELDFRGR